MRARESTVDINHTDELYFHSDSGGKCLFAVLTTVVIVLTMFLPTAQSEPEIPDPIFVGYHETWSETQTTIAEDTRLASMPSSVNVLMLAFARPDMNYLGDLQLAGTGLQVPFAGTVLHDAVRLFKSRNPEAVVLLSVGGATYSRWDDFAPASIARLVRDLNLDGVDIDFEPVDPNCGPRRDGGWRCDSDSDWLDIVDQMRAELPRPALVSVPGWSVGAFGQERWERATPRSPWTGNLLALLESPQAGHLDLVSIMAYGANESLDPLEAFDAYRAYWDGPLALGVMVPPDPADGPHYDASRVEALSEAVAREPNAGMMLYTLQRQPRGQVNARWPDASMLGEIICRNLRLGGCVEPLP